MTVADTRAFGPYEIVRRLGVGGMAETFLALRRGLHGVEQRVCLKRVLPAFAADPSFLRQFEREASIASTLRYTGIVAVVEFGDVDGAKYLALELVDGVDLRDYLASRPRQRLEPSMVGRLALDLAYSLRYAHDPVRAVVHRDVSPANVMLSRTGEVKLTDFGVARVMSSAAPTTSTGVRGKIAYMCPEHLRGEELDGRADLFALGVLLYECLCGQRPFHGAHDVEIMRRVAAGERPHVSELAPRDTPPALLAAIEGLLATDRDARTPDATALIEQLSSLSGLQQARRRLGAHVDELRGGVSTREHVTHERDEGSDTSLCPVPAGALLAADSARTPGSARPLETSVAHPPRTHKHRRRPSLRGLAALAALSLSAGALASMALSGGPPLAEAVGAVEPAAAPPRRALVAPESDAVGVAERSPRVGTTPTAAGTDAAPVAARRESTSAGLPVAAPTAEGTDARPAAGEAAPSALPRLQAAAAAHATRSVAAAPTAPVVTAPPALAVAPALATPTGVAAADRNDDPSSADREGQDTRPGTLRVTVIPWGDVWVDGRYMGRAPTEVSLRPGRHVVAAGTDRPSQRRAVQLSPGQLRRVELELQP